MEYYKILELKKEPFSNSPDPDFFYRSRQHVGCWHKLEIAIRLRRGLNVVVGDIGTGKTTLCRQLIRELSEDKEIRPFLLLDPYFSTSYEFLRVLSHILAGEEPTGTPSEWELKESIKKALFRLAVDENKLVVLILDEGQKISEPCLEILRELLNYETNEFKLLQIVIFAQHEFDETLKHMPNFADRINLYHTLQPLDYTDTKNMIQFRLEEVKEGPVAPELFSTSAYRAIYWITEGYPRKIVNLCHKVLLTLIVQNKSKATWTMVWGCARKDSGLKKRIRRKLWKLAPIPAFLLAGFLLYFSATQWAIPYFSERLEVQAVQEQIPHKPADPIRQKKTPGPDNLPDAAEPVDPPVTASRESSGNPASGTVENREATPSDSPGTQSLGTLHANSESNNVRFPVSEEIKQTLILFEEEKNVANSPIDLPYPKSLGSLTAREGEIFSYYIKEIYGHYTMRNYKMVAKANSHIPNLDRIKVGTEVYFPAIPHQNPKAGLEEYWIMVGPERSTIKEAFDTLRTMNYAPYLTILPYWNKQEGLRFLVVFEKTYPDKQAARKAVQRLPGSFQDQARVLQKIWKESTVFFSS